MIHVPSSLPEGRAGQALAVAAPLGLLLVVIFAAVQPALQWYGARQERLAEGQEQVAHILAQQNFMPQLRQQASAAAAVSGETQILLAGDSDAIAEANLQSALTTLANESGTSLTSAAVLPAQMTGSLRRVGIVVDVTANWPALTALLVAIQNARPRMIVNDLSISSSGASGGPPDASLQANFSVSAFRAGGPP